MYVDHCGVKPIDAGRLVAHFAPPEKVEKVVVAPRGVAQGVRAKKRFVVANRVVDPVQGHDSDVDRDDSHDCNDRQRSEAIGAVGGEERSASQPAGTGGSQTKKPGLDAGDSMEEADTDVCGGPEYTEVDSQVRIRHSIKLEGSREGP